MISVWAIKKGRGSSSEDAASYDLRRFTGRLSGISNSPKTSKQVLSLGLRAGLNVIILRGGAEEEDDDDDESELGGGGDDVVDVGTTLEFELKGGGGDSEDAGGRDEVVDELFKEAAEGLRGGEGTGDKRKPRMGRDSTGLDREGSCSSVFELVPSSLPRFDALEVSAEKVSRSLTSALIL